MIMAYPKIQLLFGILLLGVNFIVLLLKPVTAVSTTSSQQIQFDANFQDWCTQRCPFQNQTEEGNFDVGCGGECKIEQCSRGCELWQRALDTNCQTVCNGTQDLLPPKELYCIMGCNDAVNRYFQRLKDEIGTPSAPALVADTLTATSLSLEWEGSRYSNISYLVQWRYEELAGAWQYCRNQSWGPHSTVFVDNLQPYTKYRFRIALLLSPHHSEPIVSQPSVVISTLASGIPTSPPNIVRATAVDSSRISVSWEPGPFPNGPILSYKLQISELPEGYSALKDIAVAENKEHYMFKNLLPRRNYSLSVTMRNGIGEGPASAILVSTPAELTVKDAQQQPVLILGAHHTIIRQVADMMDEPVVMYNTTHLIKGVAIHISRRMLFVSDSAGYVYRTSLNRYQHPSTILTPSHTNFLPLDLSVDWLNNQLYMLGEVKHSSGTRWQVARCELDGRGLTIAVAGLFSKPHHIEVDPYNGYLFWVISGPRGGLYRLDLSDISNGVKHDIQPELILEDPGLGSFTVDHTNFRLLVPNHNQNTVIAVSLDGHEKLDLRYNTQQPMFHNVTSIATANGLFYWTNGKEIFTEEYHPIQDSYFHNAYPDLSDRSFVSVSVNLPSSQPMPIPVNPPTNVQAILGAEIAKTSWQVPHLLGGQGKGAWQNWSYELHIKDETRGMTIFKTDVNTTSYTIQNLMENTEYVIKTAAYTSSGIGPWSSEFRGKTLRFPQDGQYASIIWSAAEGLLKSDVTGENVETLIHMTNLKDDSEDYHITDIAWYQDRLYLVTNTTHVDWFNVTSHERGQLTEIDSVGSIAVDWIGKKLYWSNPKQQLITRGNLNGSQQEPLPILTVAKELNIDAVQAYIYWSTGHAVECARLNGEERRTYYPAELFSGKQVMGLTLDVDQRAVYWIVRSYEGSKLFQAPMAERFKHGQEIELLSVSNLQQPDMQGPLCYFSDHLLWLQDNRNAVIGDLNGQNAAVISGMSLSGLNMVAIMDPAIQQIFNTSFLKIINVIPESVSQQSIRINGTYKSFKIVWNPVTNVNYGQVFYQVKIEDFNRKDNQLITSESFVSYWDPRSLTPYSRLQITIKAFTYWAVSPQVRTVLHSPPSLPSIPTNTRVFVSYMRNPVKDSQEIQAALRWDPPLQPNGIIKGYKVKCWFTVADDELTICDSYDLNSEKQEFTAYNLLRNSTYYFQVQAYTQVGTGQLTSPIRADTDVEMPIPQLLLSTYDAVKITDCDKYENQTLSRSSGPPIDLAFLSHENKIFWLNELQELLSSNINGMNRTKILTLNNTGLSIAVDWVGRYIYWSEVDGKGSGSTINRLDLNQVEKGSIQATRVLKRPKYIHSLEVSPYKSMLFWIEINRNEVGYLMTGKTDGKHVKPFFMKNKNRQRRQSGLTDDCNCPENLAVGKAMSIDQTNLAKPKILWVDGWQNHVYSAELDGCKCMVVVNATMNAEAGLPPTSITSDQRLLYWSNATMGRVYSVAKVGNDPMVASLVKGVTTLELSGVRGIAALGPHLQPYPEPRCLSPRQFPTAVNLLSRTSESVTLALPEAIRHHECENISLATIEYSVYYGPMKDDDNGTTGCISNLLNCSKILTYNQELEIAGLKPFTRYVFFVGLKNYYSEMEGVSPMIGPPTVFPTEAGAPSSPRNITAHVVTPNTLLVQWLPPLELNDESVYYQIHWSTNGTTAGVRQTGEQVVMEQEDKTLYSSEVYSLLPGKLYSIWIRAYSQHSHAYNESKIVPIETFHEPNNITLLYATASYLNVTWESSVGNGIVRQEIQYRKLKEVDWKVGTLILMDYGVYSFILENLLPKTRYVFRLSLDYNLSTIPYVWPQDERFTFETLGDCPSSPGIPAIQHVKRDVYQLTWDISRENGAQIELYSLEGLIMGGKRSKREANYTMEDNNEVYKEDWIIYYNGSDNYWIIKELSPSLKYVFRVRSRNAYGWSSFSGQSESFDVTEAAMLAGQQELGIVLGILIPILVLISCTVGILSFTFVFRRREQDKKALQGTTRIRGPDVELATLRELPRRGNFVHNTNALYTTSSNEIPTDEEIALLPHIRRDQITLTKFLGSGAFGEVFEGLARNVLTTLGTTESRVAVKTLRKGATDQEKAEFLKEAQLMSNFKHEHILQLLGVCLDNDPNFIIMELMESGDLLSYLRISRPLIYSTNALTLLDLLAMCVDVARGCRYLEEMHFVHRDLACRNCLVSSDNPTTRIVKIGDFGLARDIYKNDYYRKEGEGLLPVRWMSPESLVDGVFTCQSDVWAFGVLMWEILTLGQQPYPARTNLEVLHYVRNGGRLGRPSNCPEELHQLMLKCWSYNPECRPTFKYCLDVLEGLKNKTPAVPLSAVHIGHYVSRTRNGGIENQGFFEDENHNSSGSSWKTESEGGSRDRVPFLPPAPDLAPRQSTVSSTPRGIDGSRNASPMNPGEGPRYLELLYDSDSPTVRDGYEIPRTSSHRTIQNDGDRPRTFSTSSTLSDVSASTSLSNQQVSAVGRIDEVVENISEVVDTKSNAGSLRKNVLSEVRKNSKDNKDLSSLEQLLPPLKRSHTNQSISASDKSIKQVTPYTNVAKKSLLNDETINNSMENLETETITKVIESNAQNQTVS